MSSVSSRVIKNTGYLYVKTFISMFVMLYVTRIVLRSLGTEDFGIYDVVGGAISMLGFLNASMANTVQRFLNNAQGQNDILLQRKVYNVSVIFHLAISIIMVCALVVLFFVLFHGVLNIPIERIHAAKVVYLCLIVSTFFNIITVPYDASINAHEDLLIYSIIGIIDIFLKLFIAILIVHASMDKLVLYASLMMLIPIATYGMMKSWCNRHYQECELSVKKYFDRTVAKEMFKFSGWSLLGTSSNLVGNYGNTIVLNHFFGTVLNAVLGIANQLQGMLLVLSSGMIRSLNPIIYKSVVSNSQKLMYYSCMGCKYSYILLSILAVPVIIEAPYVLKIWLGDVPQWTILFVRLQLIRCLLEQLTTTLNKSLESVGMIKNYNIAISLLNLLPIPLLYLAYLLGMPPTGHYIFDIFFMVFCVGIVKIWYCIRYCGLDISQYFKIVVLPCMIISAPALVLGYLMDRIVVNDSLWMCIVNALVMIFSIIFMSYIMLRPEERSILESVKVSLLNKIFKK